MLAIVMAACGGTAGSVAKTPAPGSGNSSPSVTATLAHYEAVLFASNHAVGKITVDSGNVQYQFTGWTANQGYSIDFCEFPVMSSAACFGVNTGVTTDSLGAGSGSFRFPQTGIHSGWFRFNASQNILMSGFTPETTGGNQYVAALTLHPGSPDKLQSGEVKVTSGTIHVQLIGANPNSTYHVMEANAFEGEDEVGLLMTDANGNGSADLAVANARGLVTLGQDSSGNDALRTAFLVP